jgi:hypothetical protein
LPEADASIGGECSNFDAGLATSEPFLLKY